MTSILSHTFIENDRRVKSTSQEVRKQQIPGKSPQVDFQRVLGDLEQSDENVGVKAHPEVINGKRAGENELFLSNLSLNERENSVTQLPPLNVQLKSQFGLGVHAEGDLTNSVKNLDTSVSKLAPPQPMLISEPPAMPELMSAKRISPPRNRLIAQYSETELKRIIHEAGTRHGIDPHLGLAIASTESSLRPQAVSKDGHATKGLYQLLDSTADLMMNKLSVSDNYQPFNPVQNTNLGIGYLRRLHDVFSKETVLTKDLKSRPANSAEDLEKLAIAAFNAGEGNVARAQAKAQRAGKDPGVFENILPHLPASTRTYVTRVARLRSALNDIPGSTQIV